MNLDYTYQMKTIKKIIKYLNWIEDQRVKAMIYTGKPLY